VATNPDAVCETCAAFIKVRVDERLGKVGECALEIFKPPLRAGSTCTRYRPKGAQAPAPRPRAAGEPRGSGRPSLPIVRGAQASLLRDDPGGAPALAYQHSTSTLPQEIDIDMDIHDFRRVLREVLSEELGLSRPPLGPRWQGGEVVLIPGREGTQEKRIPIDSLFQKVVMIRDRLRVLEAKLNAHPNLSAEDKVQLQAYITGCYGSLTTFNLLFSDKNDQFAGASKD